MTKSALLFLPNKISNRHEYDVFRDGEICICSINTSDELFRILEKYDIDIVVFDFSSKNLDYCCINNKIRTINPNIKIIDFPSLESIYQNDKLFSSRISKFISQNISNTDTPSFSENNSVQIKNFAPQLSDIDDLRIHQYGQNISIGGNLIRLNQKEIGILKLLISKMNSVVTTYDIIKSIYNSTEPTDIEIIDVFICTLRKKLHRAGLKNMIGTVWGLGYMMRSSL